MPIWRSDKGAELDVVGHELRFVPRKGEASAVGEVIADAAPVDAPAKLQGKLDGAPGPVLAFFVARKHGWPEAFCEIFPVGRSRALFLLREHRPEHWYEMPLTRVVLAETDVPSFCQRLCAETAPDVLTVKSPAAGTFAHGAMLGDGRHEWAAWVGEDFMVTQAVDGPLAPDATAYRAALRGSIEEARQALSAWVLEHLRGGHPVTGLSLKWGALALPKDKLEALTAAVSVKAKPVKVGPSKKTGR